MRISNNLQPEELDIMERVSGLSIDPLALAVASNIWRAAQELKSQMERTVLREYELTMASFSTIFILWIWGPLETRQIADSQNVTRGTVTSNITLLEKRGLCTRTQSEVDRRLVLVELTSAGKTLIEQVFPLFNQGEKALVADLTEEEQETLADLLRKIVKSNKNNIQQNGIYLGG